MSPAPIRAVPTNIITGFLGVGKTTAIVKLLKNKPANERWAVLVNEFGEVGVDGGIYEGQFSQQQGVFIREVPGGCMCCTAGLPMQIALNQLLQRARPDRLLIEPTGLGHPKEVLAVLAAEYYVDVLKVQQCITLIDARKLSDPRYTEHGSFNQQIDMADVIIGNKADLYGAADQQRLHTYVQGRFQSGKVPPVYFTQHGEIDCGLLQGQSAFVAQPVKKACNVAAKKATENGHPAHARQPAIAHGLTEPAILLSGFIKRENAGDGYQSVGWRFAPSNIFDRERIVAWLTPLRVERLKAVFITDSGVFSYNKTPDGITETALDDCDESRIEIIASQVNATLEPGLLRCISVVKR
ncbi:MAG TPA: GTP-binding protein [Marinagarivorans sp.]